MLLVAVVGFASADSPCSLPDGVRIVTAQPNAPEDLLPLNHMVERSAVLMGTTWTLRIQSAESEKALEAADKAIQEAKRLELILSARDAQSELYAINHSPADQWICISPELESALRKALDCSTTTQGAFDPTAGTIFRLWSRSRRSGILPMADALSEALTHGGVDKIVVENGSLLKRDAHLLIDLGGIGKGIALDAMGAILRREGFTRFCLSSTSDVLAGDPPEGRAAWVVAIAPTPHHPTGSIPLVNQAVSTSGPTNQHLQQGDKVYSHVIDPRSGQALINSHPITVQAPTAALADAYATALGVSTASSSSSGE